MSWNFRKTSAVLWLGAGLLAGLLVSGFWPSVPLHAVATDKTESFSMASGPVELDYEAVYFLDHLTGDLHAFVIGKLANGGFGVLEHSYRNILQDFKSDDDSKTPKFLMVTSVCDLNRGGRGNVLPSKAVLVVADVTSGIAVLMRFPSTPRSTTRASPSSTNSLSLRAFLSARSRLRPLAAELASTARVASDSAVIVRGETLAAPAFRPRLGYKKLTRSSSVHWPDFKRQL